MAVWSKSTHGSQFYYLLGCYRAGRQQCRSALFVCMYIRKLVFHEKCSLAIAFYLEGYS